MLDLGAGRGSSMPRRLATLMRKELAQHRALLWVLPLALGVLGLMFWAQLRTHPSATNRLTACAQALRIFVPLAALALGQALIVREYQARTQLFLQALPLRPGEVLLAKLGVGLGALGGTAVAFCTLAALLQGEFGLRVIGSMALRAFGFVLAVWSLCASFGLLGKLRVPAYLTLILGVVALGRATSFQLERFGPFALLEASTFVAERVLPARALLETALASVALLLPGALVGLWRDGVLAERLSERATAREAVAVGVVLFAEFTAIGLLRPKRDVAPFQFVGDGVARGASHGAQVLYGAAELAPRAAQVASALGALSERMRGELGIDPPPPLLAVHNGLLEENRVNTRTQELGGVLLELNLGARALDLQALRALATHESLSWLSRRRALFEPNHWLLDGFSQAWSGDAPALTRCWRRALVAAAHVELGADVVTHWERLMDQAGEDGANALGCSLVDFVGERHGRERVLELVRRLLARPTVTGLVSWWRERHATPAALLALHTGEPWPDIVDAWQRELARRRARAQELASEANDRGELTLEPSAIGADVVYALTGAPAALDRQCRLLSLQLERPYDEYVNAERAERRPVLWPAGAPEVHGRVRGLYPAGTRAWLALECHVPALELDKRVRSVRLEAP